MSLEISCRQFFDGDSLRGSHRLVIAESGIIESITPFAGTADVPLISPGFVDVQMNGFRDVNVSDASKEELQVLDNYLLSAGTTTWLGTIVTAPLERLTHSIQFLHSVVASREVAGFAGVHIEGPFLGNAPGAHNTKHIVAFDMKWISGLPQSIRMMTVAPEQDDAGTAIRALCDLGITVALGHSRPTKQQFEDAVDAGARMVTHLFNGMSGIHHRDPGLALWSLTNPKVAVGLIADLVHVQTDAVALAFQAAGTRVCLVSDSVAWMRPENSGGRIEIKDGAPRLPDGTLAGSSTPLGVCVQNAVQQCGVSLDRALASATSMPADTVGLTGVGRIRVGQPSDILALSEDLSVLKAWRRLPS